MNYNYKELIKGVNKSWLQMFDEIFNNESGNKLFEYLNYRKYTIYPYPDKVFNAFKFFSLKKTKVVLLGQDPYIKFEVHNDKEIPQAMGLSFSVPKQIKKVPPSLKNIYKEIKNSYPNYEIPDHGDLTKWVKKGKMLLLNSALTTKKCKSNYHQKKWMKFTDRIIEYISENTKNVTFILLGNFAKSKEKLIDFKKHKIIKGVHPSPLSASRGFFGSKIFENEELEFIYKNIEN